LREFFAWSRYQVLLPSPGQALEAEDASKMGPLWAHDANVLLVNPANKSISVGWEAVKEN
jgi:hypothetical protein